MSTAPTLVNSIDSASTWIGTVDSNPDNARTAVTSPDSSSSRSDATSIVEASVRVRSGSSPTNAIGGSSRTTVTYQRYGREATNGSQEPIDNPVQDPSTRAVMTT